MTEVDLRPATQQDSGFVYDLKKAALGEYVAETYGWDEAEQQHLHEQHFRPARSRIIISQGQDVGLVATEETNDRIRLLELFLLPEAQGKGIGAHVLAQVLGEADRLHRPVVLRVLKSNPQATAFYQRHGFVLTEETETHCNMEKVP